VCTLRRYCHTEVAAGRTTLGAYGELRNLAV
jgi:hypothetical protein